MGEEATGHWLTKVSGVSRQLQTCATSQDVSKTLGSPVNLRWDLKQIFDLAVSEGYVDKNPTVMLFVPREAKRTDERRLM